MINQTQIHQRNHNQGVQQIEEAVESPISPDTPKKRRAKKLPVDVSIEDMVKITQVARHPHHKLAYLFAWYSGARISEVLNIEVRDINLKEKTILIRQGKNSKDGVVPLPRHFRDEHFDMLPLVNLLKARALQKAFKLDCENAEILETKPTIHFHSLRHGFCTHCVTQGMDITRVQVLARHSNVATTSVYTHLKPKVALDNYEGVF